MELVDGKTLRRGACSRARADEEAARPRLPDGRRPRQGACRRNRSPGPEARERDGHEGRCRQDPRFRPRQAPEAAAGGVDEPPDMASATQAGTVSARSATCRPSRRAASPSISARTSSRWARFSTSWRRVSAPSSAARPGGDADGDHPGGPGAGRPGQRGGAAAVSLDHRAMPAEGPGGALRLDTRSRARRPERPRAPLRGDGRQSRARPRGPVASSPAARKRSRPGAGLTIAAVVVAAFGARGAAQKTRRKRRPPSYQQITFGSGTIRTARFAPDGQTIVYSRGLGRRSSEARSSSTPRSPDSLPARAAEREPAGDLPLRRDGDRRRLPLQPSRSLRRDAGARRADGRLAARRRRGDPGRGLVQGRLLDARDARRRAASRASSTRWERCSTRPPGHISCTRLSPDGRSDRVSRSSVPAGRHRDGRRRRPRGEEEDADEPVGARERPGVVAVGRRDLVHRDRRGSQPSLYAVTLDGKMRVVTRVPGGLKLHDIAPQRQGPGRPRELPRRDPRASAGRLAGARPVLAGLLLRRRHVARREGPALRRGGGGGGPELHGLPPRCQTASPVVRLGEGSAIALSPDEQVGALEPAHAELAARSSCPTGTGEHRQSHPGGPQPGAGRDLVPGQQAVRRRRRARRDTAPGSTSRPSTAGSRAPITPRGDPCADFPGSRCRRTASGSRSLGPDRKATLYSAADGAARPVAGAAEDEFPVRFAADGKSLYTWKRGELPARVMRVDLETRAAGGLEGADAARPGRSREDLERRRRRPTPTPMPTRSRASSRISSSSRA